MVELELAEPEQAAEEPPFDRDPRAPALRRMLEELDGLGWQKHDCVLGVDAHSQIVGNSLLSAGQDVAQHIAAACAAAACE